jgi:hypothetical protein
VQSLSNDLDASLLQLIAAAAPPPTPAHIRARAHLRSIYQPSNCLYNRVSQRDDVVVELAEDDKEGEGRSFIGGPLEIRF